MRTRIRWGLCIGLTAGVLLLSGCLFNLFQTARLVRGGDVVIAVGTGLLDVAVDDEPLWSLTPQVRLAAGLRDGVNLGVQSGLMVPLTTGSSGWTGACADLKISIVEDPASVSLAAGIGGGYGLEFLGWAVFGEVFLDSNLPALPVFVAYQAAAPLSGAGLTLRHHLAVGANLWLSDRVRLLAQVDLQGPLASFGVAVDFGHRSPVGRAGAPRGAEPRRKES